jgi:hypothetical protein
LTNLNLDETPSPDTEKAELPVGVYVNDDKSSATVSLLWGTSQGFQKRISRAVSSMPLGLLATSPKTVDGYDGKGLTIAMGILGRNKGLQPGTLKFQSEKAILTHMENASTWTPRPAKVLRSFYTHTLSPQYQTLSPDYLSAAVELALILSDAAPWAVDKWLSANLEQQSLAKNRLLADATQRLSSEDEQKATLKAHYESSYVSMVLSLNYMPLGMKDRHQSHRFTLARPDILCVGVLLKAWNHPEPSWWADEQVCAQISSELACLPAELDWKLPMAKLMGLAEWPEGFNDMPPRW